MYNVHTYSTPISMFKLEKLSKIAMQPWECTLYKIY